jgi:protein subunit release factor A
MKNWKDDCVVWIVKPPDEGGQKVGSLIYPVRVTHEPTGLVAECGYHRSQFKNREAALQMIEWGLVYSNFPLEYPAQQKGEN